MQVHLSMTDHQKDVMVYGGMNVAHHELDARGKEE